MYQPNRSATFSFKHRAFRLLWAVIWFVFASWTPPLMWRWRRLLLSLFGANLAARCDVRGSAKIWFPPNLVMENQTTLAEGVICYNVAPIKISEMAIVSQRAFLCTASHDIYHPHFGLTAKPIDIGAHSWVGSEAFVGPGVKVGKGAVLAARGAAFTNLDPWNVYRGNPAQQIKKRPDFADAERKYDAV